MQGIKGLFQGHSLTLLRIFPYAAINFYTYDWLKKNLGTLIGRDRRDVPLYWRFPLGSISGSFSTFTKGLLAVITTYPMDVVRARLAFRIGQKQNFSPRAELASYFTSTNSITSIYRGFLPTAAGMCIYSGVSFFIFDSFELYARSQFDGQVPGWSKFLFGFIAGISAQTLSYPFDVLRRRMQIYHIAPHLQGNNYSVLKMAKGIYRNEGILAFWRGLSINFIKVAPATGLSFYCYNMLKNVFEKLHHHKT